MAGEYSWLLALDREGRSVGLARASEALAADPAFEDVMRRALREEFEAARGVTLIAPTHGLYWSGRYRGRYVVHDAHSAAYDADGNVIIGDGVTQTVYKLKRDYPFFTGPVWETPSLPSNPSGMDYSPELDRVLVVTNTLKAYEFDAKTGEQTNFYDFGARYGQWIRYYARVQYDYEEPDKFYLPMGGFVAKVDWSGNIIEKVSGFARATCVDCGLKCVSDPEASFLYMDPKDEALNESGFCVTYPYLRHRTLYDGNIAIFCPPGTVHPYTNQMVTYIATSPFFERMWNILPLNSNVLANWIDNPEVVAVMENFGLWEYDLRRWKPRPGLSNLTFLQDSPVTTSGWTQDAPICNYGYERVLIQCVADQPFTLDIERLRVANLFISGVNPNATQRIYLPYDSVSSSPLGGKQVVNYVLAAQLGMFRLRVTPTANATVTLQVVMVPPGE
ncbi:MAG: hypothetical protein QXU69_08605 [Thermofilaceae archaeon]